MKTILSFDLGKIGAYAVYDGKSFTSYDIKFVSLLKYEKAVKDLIRLHNPDIISTAYPNLYRGARQNVLKVQFGLAAIIEKACEQFEKTFYILSEISAKKEIIGNYRAKKDEIVGYYHTNELTFDKSYVKLFEHQSDAMMFAEYTFKKCQE